MLSARPLLRAAALAVALLTAPATASADPEAARRGSEYIAARQTSGGAFFSAAAAADGVAEAVAALSVAGVGADAVARALEYIEDNGPARAAERAGYAGRIVMGLVAAGQNPRSFGGFDYVGRIKASYAPVPGFYETQLYANALAALGVLAAGETPPPEALTYIRANQCRDGGWAFTAGCGQGADVDTTALNVCVLAASGSGSEESLERARQYLLSAERPDGGFGYNAAATTNANSTALGIAAITALGDDAGDTPWRAADGASPVRALLAMQTETGGFRYTAAHAAANDYATVQAVPGVLRLAYPLRMSARSRGGGVVDRVTSVRRRGMPAPAPPVAAGTEGSATPEAPARSTSERAPAMEAAASRAPADRTRPPWLPVLAALTAGLPVLGLRVRYRSARR